MSRELENYKTRYSQNVYQEDDVPQGKIRVWISLDINDDPDSAKREAIWDMLTPKKVESWGTSVYTYLDKDMTELELKRDIISKLQNIDILNKPNWQNTQGVSLYITWRRHYKKEDKWYYLSGYFTLIQTATVSHLSKMTQNNIQ